MRERFSGSMTAVAIVGAAVAVVILVSATPASAQAQAAAAVTPTTPWGQPDLQGIWTDETDTPLPRPPKYATQEFFTEAQPPELDQQGANM